MRSTFRIFAPTFETGNKIITNMKQRNSIVAIAGLLLSLASQTWAANTKQTVAQVSATVELTANVDYTVSSATPFGEAGVVNIVNTDHAVLILSNVKPSEAIPMLAAHVQINGAKAVNNTNCQVKLYNRGSIILPYGNSTKPLTVYSEQNFGGESCNNFGLENSGGYMNTLSDAKLNNKIRSFKLKRGYMVTFSNLSNGRGYSRCFIAAYNDLEISELPAVMDQKISSYRVFKWYDTGKKQLANYMNKDAMSALNVQSSYDWGQGNNSFLPDYEWVPNHIYEDWPSSATIGSTSQSPHCKNNNEPLNTADDTPQDLKTILGNWENMMRTGLRLCSPASWDGSDYDNATGFLAEFLDSIDARGWRCDIIDLHCYWPEGKFNNLHNWSDKYKRPIWISEWCWGASWNNNGAFANNVSEAQVKTALQNICAKLNDYDYVERYYYWNGERDPSKLYKNGTLTPAGEYYSNMTTGLAYNGKYDFVPKTPKQYGPSKFVSMTTEDGKLELQWYDANGEFNQLMEVQKKGASGEWTTHEVITQKEKAANYTYTIDAPEEDTEYRLHLVDLDGKDYYSSEDIATGDQIDVNGTMMYVGGNMLRNGDFNMGLLEWTNGKGEAIAEPTFQVVKKGGIGGGAYLQAYGSGDANAEASIKKILDITPNATYYFRAGVLNGNPNMRLSLTTNGTSENKIVSNMKSTTSWERIGATFNSSSYSKALLSFRNLLYKAQIDKMELYRLFDTQEEAIADGLAAAKAEAAVAIAYNTQYECFNTELSNTVNATTETSMEALKTVESAIALQQKAIRYRAVADSLNEVLSHVSKAQCYSYDQMTSLIAEATGAQDAATVINAVEEVKALMTTYFDFNDASVQPKSPSFANATDWITKAGTYKEGDQKKNTVNGKSCWNAWWGLSATDNPNATMEIYQEVEGLKEGIYTLECKATTEHFCNTDQHAYIKYGDKTVVSPALANGYFDLKVDNIWETLTTAPIYVKEGENITIGFVGSKQGAVDGKWKRVGASSTGDNREGWWCATDFVLKYHPALTLKATPNEWNVTCQPYAIAPGEGVKFYQTVGFNPDYTQVCVEEVEESVAGVPVIYQSVNAEAPLLEWGESVKNSLYGVGNIRGFFSTTAHVPQNYYYLDGGVWKKQTIASGNTRPYVPNYSGIMLPFKDSKWEYIPVIEDWQGLTIPIEGVTDEEKEANTTLGIEVPTVANSQRTTTNSFYTLDGRRLQAAPTKKGIYILNGRKIVVK